MCQENEPQPAAAHKYISKEEHDRRIAFTQQRLELFTASEGWQRAVAPAEPGTRLSVYVTVPEDISEAAYYRRMGADFQNDEAFAKKDGDKPEETAAKYAKYADGDIRVTVVSHDEDGHSEIVNALRIIHYTPETGSPAIDLLTDTWERSSENEALENITLPNGMSAAKLLRHKGVYDITLASMSENWKSNENPLGSNALMALYKAALAAIDSRGGEYIIGGMDVDGIFGQLSGRGSDAWIDVFPDDHRTILSSVPDSNLSTFAICDTRQWREDMQQKRRIRHAMLWGNTFVERGVAFHGLDNRPDHTLPGSDLVLS